MNDTVTFKQIWDTLSRYDVSAHVEKKPAGGGKLSYLSWAWAWGTLMENYPAATFDFEKTVINGWPLEHIEMPDGTVEVRVTVDIHGHKRSMWLPVMDHKNNAIVDPDASAINKAKMRCLVKCLALFGLGFRLYAGEDLPGFDDEPAAPKPERKPRASTAKPPQAAKPSGDVDRLVSEVKECRTLDQLRDTYRRSHGLMARKGDTIGMEVLTTAKNLRQAELEAAP